MDCKVIFGRSVNAWWTLCTKLYELYVPIKCYLDHKSSFVYKKKVIVKFLSFFQDGSFNSGLKKKRFCQFLSLSVPDMYNFNCTKNNWILSILETKSYTFELAVVVLVST